MRILLVEDDELVADAVIRGLSSAGFTVDHAGSAELARSAVAAEHFDLAVVDIGLPGADGLTLLARLRGAGNAMPVLVLTARYALQEKIRAFDLGADDFLMKPFEQAELAARCRALVRRAMAGPSAACTLGRLLFESLAQNVGRIVTKERLLQALAGWEQDLTANAVETHISRLRGKLGDAAVIRTVRGLGYRLDETAGRTP